LKHPRSLFGALVLPLALASCAAGAQNWASADARCSANANGHVEVYLPSATVTRVLGERESRSGLHEGFLIVPSSTQPARTIKVEDNVDITGRIPLRRGDVVSLLGQLECDDYVIHWTHRDPRGRHPSGYVKVNGKLYE
jgi:Protein of unknown function (DUF3465)